MTEELTKRELYIEALRLACPAMLESFFVAFAGLVDSYMVSTLGANSVAAVGLTTQPKFMGLAFFFAVNVAISALVARRFGQKEKKDANGIFITAFASTVRVSIIRTIGSYVFGYMLNMGITGIWLGVLADQISRYIFASVRFKQGNWVKIKI